MTPKLAITTAVLAERIAAGPKMPELIERCINSWEPATPGDERQTLIRWNYPADNLGVTGSLQWLYEHTTAPIVAFLHSDLQIHESGWDERVLKEFDDPKVGVCGFGGALQLGENDIYKTRYQLTQLRRIDYMSNTTDAETHGARFTGERDVATLDGFALIVRRSLLDRLGGWDRDYPFHNYDNALCIHAHKQGYRVRLVGVSATHHGGATSTTAPAQDWWRAQGTTDAQVHEESHVKLYELGRGILPLRCK